MSYAKLITQCPHCKYIQTNHDALDGDFNPKEGDISFCIECGELGLFHRNKTIKLEWIDLSDEEMKECKRIRDAWVKTKAQQKVLK